MSSNLIIFLGIFSSVGRAPGKNKDYLVKKLKLIQQQKPLHWNKKLTCNKI